MSKYEIDLNCTKTQCVGELPEVIVRHFNLSCPSNEVFMFPGAVKHIKKNHASILMTYYSDIPDIISNPDYVGQNPKEPNSVELYKIIGDDLLIAIKLDPSGYFYLGSFYDLHNGPKKIQKRLRSGRIIPYSSLTN